MEQAANRGGYRKERSDMELPGLILPIKRMERYFMDFIRKGIITETEDSEKGPISQENWNVSRWKTSLFPDFASPWKSRA